MTQAGQDFVYGVNFSDSVWLHALMLVTDAANSQKLDGFDVYVGNSPDWSKNEKCAGGPFGKIGAGGAEIWCNKEG